MKRAVLLALALCVFAVPVSADEPVLVKWDGETMVNVATGEVLDASAEWYYCDTGITAYGDVWHGCLREIGENSPPFIGWASIFNHECTCAVGSGDGLEIVWFPPFPG